MVSASPTAAARPRARSVATKAGREGKRKGKSGASPRKPPQQSRRRPRHHRRRATRFAAAQSSLSVCVATIRCFVIRVIFPCAERKRRSASAKVFFCCCQNSTCFACRFFVGLAASPPPPKNRGGFPFLRGEAARLVLTHFNNGAQFHSYHGTPVNIGHHCRSAVGGIPLQ